MDQIFMLLAPSEATGCVNSGTWWNPTETPKLKREGLEQSSETRQLFLWAYRKNRTQHTLHSFAIMQI